LSYFYSSQLPTWSVTSLVGRHCAVDDSWSQSRDFDDYDLAVAYAAKLCGLTLRTMKHRIAQLVSDGELMVSGDEAEDYEGVWIIDKDQ
jgi:hypothetical protein